MSTATLGGFIVGLATPHFHWYQAPDARADIAWPGNGRSSRYLSAGRANSSIRSFPQLGIYSPWRNITAWPTRLLDWTTNPLVAAFFAVSAEPAWMEIDDPNSPTVGPRKITVRPGPKDVSARVIAWPVAAKHVVDAGVDKDPFTLATIKFLMPRALTTRITTQGGLFSVHPLPDMPWTEPFGKARHIFDVPGEMRAYFQRKLFYLGLDTQRIMGGLDGLCHRLAWQYTARVGLGAVR